MTDKTALPVWGIVGPRGSEVFECEGFEWEWARCHREGCAHFVCQRLSDIYCWKHLDSLPTGKEFIEGLKEKVDA